MFQQKRLRLKTLKSSKSKTWKAKKPFLLKHPLHDPEHLLNPKNRYNIIIRGRLELKSDPQECEGDPEAKKGNAGDMLAKCKAGLVDYQVRREGHEWEQAGLLQANVNTMDVCKFASDMINENIFKNGEGLESEVTSSTECQQNVFLQASLTSWFHGWTMERWAGAGAGEGAGDRR